MNNKGMTLVELIITFALVMVIVVGLYNLILEVKFQMEDKQDAKALTEFSSTINNEIHYQLLSNLKNGKVNEIYIYVKESGSDNATKSECVCSKTANCTLNESKVISLCKAEYCVVYNYGNNKNKVIGFYGTKDKKAILYGDDNDAILERIPIDLTGYVLSQKTGTGDQKIYVEYKDDYLVMNYPLYLKNDEEYTHNYGFKIAIPTGEYIRK